MLEFTKLDNNIFNTIKDVSYVLGMNSQTISNFFHGLIKPRGVLKYCVLYQSIPL